jgi:hypothetical protein
MRDPVHIFLASPSGSRKLICEAVEWSAPLVEVLDLLEDHGLTAHFERTCPVISKRDDGSTIPVPLVASQTVAEVYSRLQETLACPHRPVEAISTVSVVGITTAAGLRSHKALAVGVSKCLAILQSRLDLRINANNAAEF